MLYCRGNGVPQDHTKAIYWLEKSANQGNANAQSTLGLIYYFGDCVPKDYTKAIYWFKKASKQRDAIANYYLAKISRELNL